MRSKLTARMFAVAIVTTGLAAAGLAAAADSAGAAAKPGGTWGAVEQISGTMDKAAYPGSCTLGQKQLKPNYSFSFAGTYTGAASFASSASNAESAGVNK
jgi:hypothetical protein